MGRLRQMNREVKVARQAEMGKRVGEEMAKKTEAERIESLRRDRQRPRPAKGQND